MARSVPPWPLPGVVILLSSLALFLFISPPVASAPADDADALLRFKESLGNSDTLKNWVVGTTPCRLRPKPRWVGVLCYNETLWGLQLENMGLTGMIDVDALVGLNHLRTISIAGNSFDGPFPDFSKLGALKSVYVSRNAFSGEIPAEAFASMGSLKKLHLSHNEFTGSIPVSLTRAGKLIDLRLDDNQFTGKIPDFKQAGLNFVNVSSNQLEGPIPAVLSNLNSNLFSDNKDLCGKPLDMSCGSPKKKISTVLLVILILIGIAIALGILWAIWAFFRRDSSEEDELSRTAKGKTVDVDGHEQGSPRYSSVELKTAREQQEQGRLVFVASDRERFELQDLMRASAEVLRSSNFGSSYKAALLSGSALVVKRFRQMNGVGREDFQEHMRRLGRLKHTNLVPLVAFYYRKDEKLLVTDFIGNESLVQALHGNRSPNHPTLDWPARLRIVKGVARGLSFLHMELPTLILPHGHLKSSNVVLGENFEPLLTDYGLDPVMSKDAKHLLVAYQSPEYAQTGQVTRKSDVWSLGILILEILTGKYPANFLPQGGSNDDADLAGWVNSVVREEWTGEVFDKDMERTRNAEGEMLKLLTIGLGCCELDMGKRWDLEKAAKKIEELKEMEYDDSSYASDSDVYTTAVTDDEFSFSRNN
ncbi:pollen receptor-like kinase 4 [Aristolochia californica]|uniref:pollen receptor-like kinase 4 n=1 Tax=Aristolochia californica TaxID=171875 RepID=UPI0035DB0DFF